MKTITIKCACCGKEYEKEIKKYNYAEKMGWRHVCSKKCSNELSKTGNISKCSQCGKEIYITPSLKRKSKSGLLFCSRRCSCIHKNTGRKRTDSEKEKISNSLRRKDRDKICIVCGKPFHAKKNSSICCSVDCGYIKRFGVKPYLKEEVICIVKDLITQLGETPSSKLDRRLCFSSKKYWGGWNKMMASLGYKPNTQWVSKKNLKCKDGHKADSISEMIVDDWFFEKGIKHERRKPYPESKCDCDFYLPDFNVWIEYFGLKGEHKEYDRNISKKLEIANKHNIILISLTSKDIYPENKICEKLEWML